MKAHLKITRVLLCLALLGSLFLVAGCPSSSRSSKTTAVLSSEHKPPCPAECPALPELPGQQAWHDLPEFWLAKYHGMPEVVISPEQIVAHNQQVQQLAPDEGKQIGRWDVTSLRFDEQRLRALFRAKLEHLQRGVHKGTRVLRDGERPTALLDELQRLMERSRLVDEIRVVARSTPLRCFPTSQGVYEKAWDLAFDLMQCAQLRFGEPVRVVARSPRFSYVWSSYADGWVYSDALSPPLAPEEAAAFIQPSRFVVVQRDQLTLWADQQGQRLAEVARLGARFPLIIAQKKQLQLQLRIPTTRGLAAGWLLTSEGVSDGFPALSRTSLFRRAFDLLDTPYGWGGLGHHRDCSRLMMDLFQSFGVQLPRNTWQQAKAGLRRVDVEQLDEKEKRRIIEETAEKAIVLLYMPGHIMLYLGRDGERLYAFHLFSGFLIPCPGGGETMNRVNRTVVTSLELGRGSSRRSFIERITRLILFEPAPQSQE